MKIVLVIDQFDSGNNGTTITAQRFAVALRKRGHRITVIACGESSDNKVAVQTIHVPFFNRLISSQGMQFARPDDKAYYRAFQGADIVHFFLPFQLCRRGEEIARQMKIPTIAAYHTQPENITYSIGLGHSKTANQYLYTLSYRMFYNRFSHIHCPSQFIAKQLMAHGFDAKLHVISNGVDAAFHPMEAKRPQQWENRFVILMIGRLSGEKRQDLIIEAAQKSRYHQKIQLVFAGQGPKEKEYKRLGQGLDHPPIFGFFPQNELAMLINACDLYVHASDAEIEGISCMEAFSCGLVPVISDSPLSASNQFALTKQNLFHAGDADSLAERMDYWVEHPDEKKQLGKRYAAFGNTMRVDSCVRQAEEMYQEAIQDYKQHGYKKVRESRFKKLLHPNVDKDSYRYCPQNILTRSLFFLVTNLLSVLLFVIDKMVFHLEIDGRQYLKGICGGITVMNHVHPMDCTMAKLALFPHSTFFISLKRNFQLPFTGWLVRWLGGIPIPEAPSEMKKFQNQIEKAISRGDVVHFYPEGQLVRYDENIREFHKGAFLTAVRTGCAIIPMVIAFKQPTFPFSLFKKKPCFQLLLCEPQYANISLSHGAAVEELMKRTRRIMVERLRGASPHDDKSSLHSKEKAEAYSTY